MNNWASNYIDRVNSKEETEISNKKAKLVKELNAVSKQLRGKFGKYSKEAKYIENKIIPYIERMAFYPPSYREMVEEFKELLDTAT